jgi:hypothetical protein
MHIDPKVLKLLNGPFENEREEIILLIEGCNDLDATSRAYRVQNFKAVLKTQVDVEAKVKAILTKLATAKGGEKDYKVFLAVQELLKKRKAEVMAIKEEALTPVKVVEGHKGEEGKEKEVEEKKGEDLTDEGDEDLTDEDNEDLVDEDFEDSEDEDEGEGKEEEGERGVAEKTGRLAQTAHGDEHFKQSRVKRFKEAEECIGRIQGKVSRVKASAENAFSETTKELKKVNKPWSKKLLSQVEGIDKNQKLQDKQKVKKLEELLAKKKKAFLQAQSKEGTHSKKSKKSKS